MCVCVLNIDSFSLFPLFSLSHAGPQLHPGRHGDPAQHWSGCFVYPLFYLKSFQSQPTYARETISSYESYSGSAGPPGSEWAETGYWGGRTGTERRPGPSEAAPSPRPMVLTELGPVHAEPKEAVRKLVKCPNSWTTGRWSPETGLWGSFNSSHPDPSDPNWSDCQASERADRDRQTSCFVFSLPDHNFQQICKFWFIYQRFLWSMCNMLMFLLLRHRPLLVRKLWPLGFSAGPAVVTDGPRPRVMRVGLSGLLLCKLHHDVSWSCSRCRHIWRRTTSGRRNKDLFALQL